MASEAARSETIEATLCGEVMHESTEVDGGLRQFRQAIDNSQPYLLSHLHLHHLGRQALTNPMGILQLKLNLPATSLNEVKEQ
jgi:hypothetical protein